MGEKLGIYAINNFGVRTQTGYALSIVLDGAVVEAIVNSHTKRDNNSKLFKSLNSDIKRIGGNLARLDFFKDSWFLDGIVIGNNCACFTIGSSIHEIEKGVFKNIVYSPHNIDHSEQANALLMTWLNWFNIVISETEFELPFAI